uniref:Nonribosomal peptide synthase n=1 Tax=Aspergillus westerdijkiae TaxID=357447 RepID=A0A8B0SXY7_9EURO|nr:nonribosomal peptide synthase [Aspergillus westerdijkiae]
MESRASYRFPCLTDGHVVNDKTWKSTPLSALHGFDGWDEGQEEKVVNFLGIAWAILLFVYDEANTVQFEIIRNRERKTASSEINRDQLWQDIQFRWADSVEFESTNSGICIFTERDIEIPPELQIVLLVEDLDSLTVSLAYRTNLISHAQALNIASTLNKIAEEMNRPNISIGEIDVLDERNLDQISKFSTGPRRVEENYLHSIIERQAIENPDHIAVDAWDARLTYQELNYYASKISERLSSLNVANTYVPLCAEKSAWAIVAMLAILKAGAACSPLEPSHPRDRLKNLIRACGATAVVVTAPHASMLEMEGIDVVVVSSKTVSSRDEGLACVANATVAPRSPAFLMWTSGSTGNPKGVVLEHAALYMSIATYAEASNFTAQTRTFQFTSFTFTVSICDIFGTMSKAGKLCMPSDEQRLNDLSGALRASAASFCWLTSTSLTGLDPENLPDLQSVTVGGESLSPDIVARWAGKCQINVSYGTTETCGWCLLNPNLTPERDSRVLGKPIIPAAWICDPNDMEKLVPVGAVGELLIEGPFLARGYLNDEERTAAQFIQAPSWMKRFRPGQSTRLYRTNDLARLHSDGSVAFVGRKQAHAKIRGNRINLIDIEHHVRRAWGRSEVVVEVVHTKDRYDVLIAFLLAPGDMSENQGSESPVTQANDVFRQRAADALQVLQTSLPSYMIPTAFVPLTQIPLTRTNKTDRRLLREEAGSRTRAELVQLTARNGANAKSFLSEEECLMQELWSELIGHATDQIGPDDSFFHLGGDSVMAIRLVSLARKHGLVLTVMDIFRHPKLRDLVSYINDREAEELPENRFAGFNVHDLFPDAARECGVNLDAIEDLYPCTALQEGLMALSAQRTGAYVLQMACDIPLAADLARLLAAWETVVDVLPVMRTRIVQLGRAGFHQAVVKEKIDWRSVTSEAEWRDWNHKHPMQLGCPLARFALLRVDSRPSRILIAIHHSIFDRWSSPLLLEMLDKVYQGQEVQRQEFKNFVAYAHSISPELSDAFWEEKLRGDEHAAFPSVEDETYLPKPNKSKEKVIKLESSRSNFTATTKLRLCWALVLAQHTENNDVVFGAVSTGRSAPVNGIEGLIGPTLATVPFRVKIDPEVSVARALETVQSESASTLLHEQRGLQNIAKVSADMKSACKFENILIVHAPNSGSGMRLLGDMADDQLPELFSYGLTLSCEVVGPEQIHVHGFFDPNLIGDEYVESLLSQLEHTVQQIHDVPDCRLGDIDLFSTGDEALLQAWNSRVFDSSKVCVHEAIQEQCAAHPEAEAVCSWDGSFSYRSLELLSTNLAGQLIRRGVGPASFVPLLFEKSKWTVVAIFAVMKSGGAFLLLDPSFPEERLQTICDQINAQIILSSKEQANRARSIISETIVVDEKQTPIPVPPITLPTGDANNALYAVFTSGSTGKPKGVVIDHAAYASGARAHTAAASISSSSRVLQFSSYAFDASIIEHLTTLMAGACICIISDTERSNSLPEAIASRDANWTWLTPSVLRTMNPQDVPSLKHVCLMGEASGPAEIQKWSQQLHLMQAYGPAECSVLATLQSSLNLDSDPRNIGFPTGCTGWVVDKIDSTRLTPVGAVGELLIEGPIVGRGYYEDQVQTERGFISAPDWIYRYREPGSERPRLYRTGDLVKYAPQLDGALLYASRKDNQVKIRGQRLELTEVEYHAREAASLPWDIAAEVIDLGCRRVLALFFAEVPTKPEERCTILRLSHEIQEQAIKVKQKLSTRLPAFMIPTAWIPLSMIPLSVSKKTDRRRIRDLAKQIPAEQLKSYIIYDEVQNGHASNGSLQLADKPMTEEEIMLHDLICDVLESQNHDIDRNSVTMDERLTTIGGDSLIALALVSRAKKSGFTFTAADVIACTLGELAVKRI